jgi:hypothetical protein
MKKSTSNKIKAAVLTTMIGGATLFGSVSCDTGTNSIPPETPEAPEQPEAPGETPDTPDTPEQPETPQPKECECQEKIHGTAPCDCGGIDCACEQKEWALNHGIKLDNQTNVLLGQEGKIELINLILDDLKQSSPATIAAAANGGMKIIVESSSYNGYTKNGNIFKISINSFVNRTTLEPIVIDAVGDVDTIAMNKFNSIRMAKAERLWEPKETQG